MKKIIVANFKMNPPSLKEANALFKAYDIKTKHTIILCPPFVYLRKGKYYALGAQNCFYKNSGAYTGEISPTMLKNLGCDYVILGHSERKESIEEIDLKVKACLENDLKVILCISELSQLKNVKDKSIIIAYEPISAIGTGKAYSLKDISRNYNSIKERLKENKILYGGSVTNKNAKDILDIVDGVLIGGASIHKQEFLNIIK
ncbi:MAG: triose-phosphate isomerase [Candidatus Pacebacteria bacterium]|nr:triose-phosphate isomerase [Candidatus Paceibacterota bacterium]MDD2796457.1 triose-phosphate isomerase [Candidatus Paceibacterota bacterium]MDD3047843.1 triose-phosphate isomerase [Candidatus Paceibacterota bacterium]MDD3509671.1 triose-phosphate isomerase [Candidatus Paceibacterota bacterium]MDD3918703.1 triose-phosphate isomerase [Candidatus Paceibacterota bacterium]